MRTKADLLLHPVRLRIVQALVGGRRLSPAELARELGDVPPATLYRHVNALADGGVLAVAGERAARGTPERVFALVEGAASLGAEDLAAATPSDHLRYFTIFVAGLIGDFGRYLGRERVDFVADGVGYRQIPLELTDEEFAALVGRLDAAFAPALGNAPAPGRRRRLFTTVVVPVEPPEEDTP
jgi:DNA-binding transcriptional ArsR family regulator